MKKESKVLIFYLFLVGAICIVNYLIRITFHPAKGDDLIYFRAGSCAAVLFLFGYLLYSWKSDMHTFLKRILFSIPFALALLAFIKVMGFWNPMSIIVGVFISLFLLFKTPDWKRHYAAVLIPVIAFIVLLKFVTLPLLYLNASSRGSLLRISAAIASIVPILSFSSLYLSKLLYASAIEFKAILIRSIKFSIVACLFFMTYLILNDVGDRLSLSLPFQLMLNSLLAISFLVICYRFDLLLIERINISGKNILSGFWNELNNLQGKTNPVCECCGKPTPQELLFKTDSDQWVCAACLPKMD